MDAPKHYLGIDYGSRRIGLAIGDDQTKIARPLSTITNQPETLLKHFKALADQYQITELVVGLPRGLDGQETAQTRQTVSEVTKLMTGLPALRIHWQDEAGTSQLAEVGRPDKAEIDAAAAALILQDYLNNL